MSRNLIDMRKKFRIINIKNTSMRRKKLRNIMDIEKIATNKKGNIITNIRTKL